MQIFCVTAILPNDRSSDIALEKEENIAPSISNFPGVDATYL
jgi:hypothetical protein